ncbi:NaeI family type II restriction endonuclease [Kitasatospora sp. NBC_01246]|uniref:NaeI family type II restriction endonuclease n=1 Tax=Kitasatospora sp. NBC_01246 TaxID=2903570 RepID=UPI002E339BF1|nr:NaeI family type II restriction endonuclease [Kitasatospora sp. NBC_01246]
MTLPLFGFDDSPVDDPDVAAVQAALYALDPDGRRTAGVIRSTIDQLLDGRRMGRWSYKQLHKTEKTHLGTLLEINLYKDLRLEEGEKADYLIEGIEVDCKYANALGGWEIGPELVGCLCLVITASDSEKKSTWQAGLVRASEEHLRTSTNRDSKRKLNAAGVQAITWLWGGENQLEPNQLLGMSDSVRTQIMGAPGKHGPAGQARINKLFELFQGEVVRRVTLETVGHGLDDPLKRARANGGARDYLRPKGILVLGHQDRDPEVAVSLGLDVPLKGQFISARVVPAPDTPDGRPVAVIGGASWVLARGDEQSDPPVPAPVVPKS